MSSDELIKTINKIGLDNFMKTLEEIRDNDFNKFIKISTNIITILYTR